MSCPHFTISIRQRSKGKSAIAGAAYQSGEKLFSEYDLRTKNYVYKLPEVTHKEILLPFHAPSDYNDRQTLWNAVEKSEKQWNAQLSRGIIVALPREIPKEQYAELVRDYCMEQFVAKGMCVDFAVHDKGDGNPHAHIMLTMRAIDENGKWLPKSKKVYELDENGKKIILPSGEPKSHKEDTVDWNSRANAELWRSSWADTVNRYYEKNNIPIRLDLRSYERQGVDQVPTIHLGPAVSHMEKKGIQTDVGEYNRYVKAHNAAVSNIKKLIASLENWIAEVKEMLSPLFIKEEKKPTLISFINDYNNIRRAERSDWSFSGRQKGSSLDLQFTAKAFNWMQNAGISTLDDFERLIAEQKPILNQISENDKQIRTLSKTIEYIDTFKKYSSVYAQSKKGFTKAKEKFAAEHKSELEAYTKAVRYMKARNLTVDDLVKCREKRDSLRAKTKELRDALTKSHLDPDMVRSIQHCVATVLNYRGEIPEGKSSIIAQIRERQPRKMQAPNQRTDMER